MPREAHAHLASIGESLRMPALDGCASLTECLDAVAGACAEARAANPERPFARLHSARPQAWNEARWPTLAELDRASGRTPCVVLSFDFHAAVANTAAMASAGLAPGVVVPPNGTVMTDKSGAATGLLLEQAAFAAWNAAPAPAPEVRETFVHDGLEHLRSLGYSEVHDLHSQPWLGDVLASLERQGRLPMAVRLYPNVNDLEAVAARRRSFESRLVRLAGGKIFADGTLNSRTALMMHRYCEPIVDLPRGKAMMPPADIDRHLRRADELGLPMAVHAIGDGAVRMVLDCFERVRPRTPGGRIEHCELIDRADVGRFVKRGVSCSVQPCHLLADVEALRRFVSHRLDRVLPLRELLASGLRPGVLADDDGGGPGLVFGSDAPIVRADPADSIQAAVHRRRPGAPAHDAIAPEQAITEDEAWACFGGRTT